MAYKCVTNKISDDEDIFYYLEEHAYHASNKSSTILHEHSTSSGRLSFLDNLSWDLKQSIIIDLVNENPGWLFKL